MRKAMNKIQHLLVHAFYTESKYSDYVINFICDMNVFLFGIMTVFFSAVGIVINVMRPFPNYTLFQFLFTFIFIVSFFSIRYFEKQSIEIHRLMAGDRNLQPISDKNYRIRHSKMNLLIPLCICAYFGILALTLVNVELNTISALYLILIYTICVTTSLLGYLQYVYLSIFIKNLSCSTSKIRKYNQDYPSNTNWLVALAHLFGIYRNIFFILGITYVFGVIYFVLCDGYNVLKNIAMNPWLNISIVLFWGGVLGAIVIFFPISCALNYLNIKKIVNHLKEQTIVDINSVFCKENDPYLRCQKSNLIIALMNTPAYPFKDAVGTAFSGIVTCINLAASIVAILQFKLN